MSLFSAAYDRNVKGGSLKRRRWDPVGEINDYLHRQLGTDPEDIVDEEDIPKPNLFSGEIDPNARLGAYHESRKKKYGRLAANLNKRSGASILTS